MHDEGTSAQSGGVSLVEWGRVTALLLCTVLLLAVPPVQALIPADRLPPLQAGVLILDLLVIASLIVTLWRPGPEGGLRCYLNTAVDCSAVSLVLFAGEGLLAPASVLYLWCIVGRGFTLGIRHMLVASAFALASFGVVYSQSAFWQNQPALTVTVLSVIVLLVPFLVHVFARAQRAERLAKYRADYDSLTRLLNRRAFKERLESTLEVHRQADDPTSVLYLLFIDLDRFKPVNDEAGHAAGDQALVEIAGFVQSICTAPEDLAGRVGGDEFCVCLTNRQEVEAQEAAERLRAKVDGYRLKWGSTYFRLGVSVGLATSMSVNSGEELIRLADAACYAAKHNGRNRVHALTTDAAIDDTQAIRKLTLPPEVATRAG
ncbi:MAG: GGDEF domain-containing protein [Pseudomonadota bacterium]